MLFRLPLHFALFIPGLRMSSFKPPSTVMTWVFDFFHQYESIKGLNKASQFSLRNAPDICK